MTQSNQWEVVLPLGRAFLTLLFDPDLRESIRRVIDGIEGGKITREMLEASKGDREALEAAVREALAGV